MKSMMLRGAARQTKWPEPVWVIDVQDWLDRLFSDEKVPRLNVRLKKLAEIITYATANAAGIAVDIRPNCWKRPIGKTCRGVLEVDLVPEKDEIRWSCPACGNQGALTGWRGEYWDMTSSFTSI